MASISYPTPFDLPNDMHVHYFPFLSEHEQLGCALLSRGLRDSMLQSIQDATKHYRRDTHTNWEPNNYSLRGTREQDYLLRQIRFYKEHLPGKRPHFNSLNQLTLRDRVVTIDPPFGLNIDRRIEAALNAMLEIDQLPFLNTLKIQGRNIPRQLLFHLINEEVTPGLKKVALFQSPSINRAFLTALSKRQITHLYIDSLGFMMAQRLYPAVTIGSNIDSNISLARARHSMYAHLTAHPLPYALTDYSGYQALHTLSFRYINNLTDEVTQHIGQSLPHLRNFQINNCIPISVTGYHNLFNGTRSLREVSFEYLSLNRQSPEEGEGTFLDESAEAISDRLNEVQTLSVRVCSKINSFGLVHLFNPQMRELNLDRCNLSDEGVEIARSQFQQLEILKIERCKFLTNQGLRSFIQPSLTDITLGSQQVDSETLQALIQGAPRLTSFYLSDKVLQLTSHDLDTLRQYPSLTHLTLYFENETCPLSITEEAVQSLANRFLSLAPNSILSFHTPSITSFNELFEHHRNGEQVRYIDQEESKND